MLSVFGHAVHVAVSAKCVKSTFKINLLHSCIDVLKAISCSNDEFRVYNFSTIVRQLEIDFFVYQLIV